MNLATIALLIALLFPYPKGQYQFFTVVAYEGETPAGTVADLTWHVEDDAGNRYAWGVVQNFLPDAAFAVHYALPKGANPAALHLDYRANLYDTATGAHLGQSDMCTSDPVKPRFTCPLLITPFE